MEECIFCKIVEGELPSEKIYENDKFISFPDANPRVKGHALVIPKKHFKDFLGLPGDHGEDLIDCINKTASKVMGENSAGGFNIINNNSRVAGQIVNHLHFHILPRKEGDRLRIVG